MMKPMIFLLLQTDDSIAYYFLGGILTLTLIFFFFRWIFLIDKRVRQNHQIIGLLKLLAEKAGVTKEDIDKAKYTGQY